LAYPFGLTWKGEAYGVGHYFGPVVLAFAPLLVFAVRKGLVARCAVVLWAAVFLPNALTSQSARFLLPSYSLALALVLAGLAEAFNRRYQMVRAISTLALVVFFLFGAVSEALYARDFLPVVVGLEKQDLFLERMAPDYGAAAFINRSLRGQGKVMVFFPHMYYLRVPFITGDPEISWLMDPDRIAEPQKLLDLLHQENVRWVVKSPDYPEALAPAFQALEDQGRLRPVYSTDISTFTGFRIYGQRVQLRMVILEVTSPA
jgi:phage shock protein PspC (stress-responsive transcriptional regulator)